MTSVVYITHENTFRAKLSVVRLELLLCPHFVLFCSRFYKSRVLKRNGMIILVTWTYQGTDTGIFYGMNQTDSVSVNPAGSFSGNCNDFEMAGTLERVFKTKDYLLIFTNIISLKDG